MHIIALNRHWVIYWRWLAVALVAIAILISLTIWQWQRALDKTQFLQKLAHSPAVSAQQLKDLSLARADGLQLLAQAHWLEPLVWLLDNQMRQGRPGYDVIVPMQLDAADYIVLVNLGWVAAPLGRSQLPEIAIPSQFTIQGMLRTHLGGLRLGQNSEDNGRWPMRIQQIDIAELSGHITRSSPSTSVYPGVVYQLQGSPYMSHYRPVVVSPERHRAYALQWGLLALAVVAVALAASLEKNKFFKRESLNADE